MFLNAMNLNTFTLGDELAQLTGIEPLEGEREGKLTVRGGIPVRKAELRLKCPKCGGNHSAIRCESVKSLYTQGF